MDGPDCKNLAVSLRCCTYKKFSCSSDHSQWLAFKNIKITKTLLVLVLILLAGIAPATADACPLVTQESIYGVWEALYQEDTIRIFRLELMKEGVSVLSQGLPYGNATAAWVESMEIDNGFVTLRLREDSKPRTYVDNGITYTTTGEILMKGLGVVCRNGENEDGAMDLQLILEPNAPTPVVRKLKFIKSSGKTLIEEINSRAEAAKNAASVLRMRLEKK